MENILFGTLEIKDETLKIFSDVIIFEAKWQLWKNNNNVKYGNKTSYCNVYLLNQTIEQCKLQYPTIEKFNSVKLDNKIKRYLFFSLLCSFHCHDISPNY